MGAERAAGAWRFDRFTLDLARGALLGSDGAEVPLRPKSFALLRLLVENAGRLLDRDAIMAAVWPDGAATCPCPAQGGANPGRKVTSASTGRRWTCSTTRPSSSSVLGSAQCTSS